MALTSPEKEDEMGERFSLRSALAAGLIAAIVMTAMPVVASVGQAILAGKTTTAGKQTTLKGAVASTNLKVVNTKPGGSSASFVVEPGNAPSGSTPRRR